MFHMRAELDSLALNWSECLNLWWIEQIADTCGWRFSSGLIIAVQLLFHPNKIPVKKHSKSKTTVYFLVTEHKTRITSLEI